MNNFENWLLKNITLHSHDNKQEEFWNGLTHLFGSILSLAGLILLLLKDYETPHMIGATLIYSISMLLLFSASTTYHWVSHPLLKRIGRVLDHSNIYLLIAGTYTPMAFFVGGTIGLKIILIEWCLAFVGIIFTLKFWGRLKPLHILFYLLMGWIIVFIWSDFTMLVPIHFARLVILGGIFYTVGVVIYSFKKIPFYHAIWHLFVVGGAMSMFVAIYKYVI